MEKQKIVKHLLTLFAIAVFGLFAAGSGGGGASHSSPSSNSSSTKDLSSQKENITIGQKNALKSAKNYLTLMGFSKAGLIKQLEFEGYTTEDATYASENCNADWNEQAAKSAKNYLNTMPFSKSELIRQLEFDGYSKSEAEYGAKSAGY